MKYKVKLRSFEGPLDLLVYLIESSKMDIYDIQINDITKQYLEYIKTSKKMNIDVGADFMTLAASLLYIKSKMLLPQYIDNSGEMADDDPRKEIVDMILEYKKFKKVAIFIGDMIETAQRVVEKPMEDMSDFTNNPIEVLSLKEEEFKNAFENFLVKRKRTKEIKSNYERVEKKRISTEERIKDIRKIIYDQEKIVFGQTLKNQEDCYDVALSFVSILELIKQKEIQGRQEYTFGDITLEKGENLTIDRGYE